MKNKKYFNRYNKITVNKMKNITSDSAYNLQRMSEFRFLR